jgi:uncharacterized phage protein gp47/JayE
MTTYGVTPEGFRRPTLEELIRQFEDEERAEIGDDLDVSAESIPGQFNGIYGRSLSIAWEALEAAYHGFDPDAAEGRLLEMLAKLTGTFRKGSTPSEVVLTCNLDAGTTIEAGTHFAAIVDQPEIRWTPKETYTAPSSGPQPVTFVSELLGPVEGYAGTITVIATPVSGWHSVVNPNDAELGTEIDTDPELRLRRERELASMGSATARAIKAEISRRFFDKLETLEVFENETDSTVDGVPPHSIEVLIFDGEVPSVDNDELAQVIWDTKAAGIQPFGTTSGMATVTVQGIEMQKPVGFTRASQREVYLEIDIVKTTGYLGDDAVKQIVATACNKRFGPGNTVVEAVIMGFVTALPGVFDVPGVRLGFSPSPTGVANLPILLREVARFSTSRIVLNVTQATRP